MTEMPWWSSTALGLFLIMGVTMGQDRGCGPQGYNKCVQIADPLLTDAHMIFPDNMVDIDNVCRTWTKFVECIRVYIGSCLTEKKQQEFNKAVETPVNSVHEMCTSSTYQTEYLQHATCLKDTLTDDRYCGRHYRYLAAQVQGSRDMRTDDLCCSHQRFRDCVLTETRRVCDVKLAVSSKMLPSAFSRQVLDKSLSFLRDQCDQYSPKPGDCAGYQSQTTNRVDKSADDFMDTTHVIGPSYSIGNTHSLPELVPSTDHKDREPSEPLLPTIDPTWLPSRDGRRRTTEMEPETETTNNDVQTRSSYGRGVTWEPAMTRDDLFKATHYKPSTDTWYPGNNINYQKEVEDFNTNTLYEEPNQQGLAHFDENSGNTSAISINLLLTLLVHFVLALLT